MTPENKQTLNRLRKNKLVRLAAVGTVGFVVISKMAGTRGYMMVRPDGHTPDGAPLMKAFLGKRYWIDYSK